MLKFNLISMYKKSIRVKIYAIVLSMITLVVIIILSSIWFANTLSTLTDMARCERGHTVLINNGLWHLYKYISNGEQSDLEVFKTSIDRAHMYTSLFGNMFRDLEVKGEDVVVRDLAQGIHELDYDKAAQMVNRVKLLRMIPLVQNLVSIAADADKATVSFKEHFNSWLSETDPVKKASAFTELNKEGIILTDIATKFSEGVADLSGFTINLIVWALVGLLFILSAIGLAISLRISSSITGPLENITYALKDISEGEGDLTKRIELNTEDERGEMALYFNRFVEFIHDIIFRVQVSAEELSLGIEQISSGNQNLAQRTTEQASSIEEMAATIEETSATITQNTDNAGKARETSSNAVAIAEKGGAQVNSTVTIINDMKDSSKKIGEIINVINEISFQTNLLALNASVEAARAGDHGRGFAVVAGEVRNLAQRSASSAKEIEKLIKDSLELIENGAEQANNSGRDISEIINSVRNVSGMITEISVASEEQMSAMKQINTAISELDAMTQQNSSMVEETAGAAEEIAAKAVDLLNLTRSFKIRSA